NVPGRWLERLELGGSDRWRQLRAKYAYWEAVRRALDDEPTWQQLTHGPIVLLYHAIGADGEPPSRYVMPVRRFEQQMSWLRARRYVPLGLDELLSCFEANRLTPANAVVVTFDDAYLDT